MNNTGEEVCGEYLKHILKCDFVTYNTTNPDIQGEIDVIGIKLLEKEIYVCEVATHIQGLQYTNNNRPDNYNRFYKKFEKNINYVNKHFQDYNVNHMLWSPIVRVSPNAKYNAYEELKRLQRDLQKKYKLELKLIINQEYDSILKSLKEYASKQTAAFISPVMRIFQIESYLKKHVRNLEKRKKSG
tara:strand:- start:68 stop:625 length:558 start_codon:yes stop_codon:yes gene_type:complete